MTHANEQRILPNTKGARAFLGAVLVVGLGKSAHSTIDYLLEDRHAARSTSLCVYAGMKASLSDPEVLKLTERGVRVVCGTEEIEGVFDTAIISPGIPQTGAFYQSARAHTTELMSEVEFAWRESAADAKWVVITGTNGKSTVTALTAHVLSEAGLNACAVGNIGACCIDAVARGDVDYYVCEASSYQLASIIDMKPEVACLLNITPDHLAWHGGFEAYAEAKYRSFEHMLHDAQATVFFDTTDEMLRERYIELSRTDEVMAHIVPVGRRGGYRSDMRAACGAACASFVNEAGKLCLGVNPETTYTLCSAADLQIVGEHNVGNALHAASCAYALGVDPDAIAAGLMSFHALEHRIEPAGSVGGVLVYNDSKATNVDATLKALSAFTPRKPIVLLGGFDKMTALDELVAACERETKAVVCFGAAGERFFEAFSERSLPKYHVEKLYDALVCALDSAERGDIVLLSPACSSFDEFGGFEERGRVFKSYVRDLAQSRGA